MTNRKIQINQNFHASINIGLDFYNDSIINSLILTPSAYGLIEDIITPALSSTSRRAKLLIGAYGRGKSHILLAALAILNKRDRSLLKNLLSQISIKDLDFFNQLESFFLDGPRLLPVIISGNTLDLSQSFLQSLSSALDAEGHGDLMPATNYRYALETVLLWRDKYPETYTRFLGLISDTEIDFLTKLEQYDSRSYAEFLRLYPALTSGGSFNTFKGLNTLDVYDSVINSLKDRGYGGIYVVYDEFSKYLESNIQEAPTQDVKFLQDFAEKCDRSGPTQLHLTLVSHKDISNYIDSKLPKERVDGWRGVSGRFEHLEIRGGFGQSYELIAATLMKDEVYWARVKATYAENLAELELISATHNLIEPEMTTVVVEGCFPLHPISTFVLPRISEKVAQNERTLFTYLSSKEDHSLGSYLEAIDNQGFSLVTPDSIYDYFEPLFRKEPPASEIHKVYGLCRRVLRTLPCESLEVKIVKTIALIYFVGQFERLAPTIESVTAAFSSELVTTVDIAQALDLLINNESIVYLKSSNGHLKIKASSGVKIDEQIERSIELSNTEPTQILNHLMRGKAVYPSRYNSMNEIVRYFNCRYISSAEYWGMLSADQKFDSEADGIVVGIIPSSAPDRDKIEDSINKFSKLHPEIVFVLPLKIIDISKVLLRFNAAGNLKSDVRDDETLTDEYEIYIEDYLEFISLFISSFFRPELKLAEYYYSGKIVHLKRRSQLSELLSEICDRLYPNTPIINNESINKNILSPAAVHSRTKILTGLCAGTIQPNLGLSGNGQECSMMRSVFALTGIIDDIEVTPKINLSPSNKNIARVLSIIREFIFSEDNDKSFEDLYCSMTGSEKGIGLKRGLCILFIAAVMRNEWRNIVLTKNGAEQHLAPGTLNELDSSPSDFSVYVEQWNQDKATFVEGLNKLFEGHFASGHMPGSDVSQTVQAMTRWYLSLPRFAKVGTQQYLGLRQEPHYRPLEPEIIKFMNSLKRAEANPREYVFEELGQIFSTKGIPEELAGKISTAKSILDNYLSSTLLELGQDVKNVLDPKAPIAASSSSTVAGWIENADSYLDGHIFPGSINDILQAFREYSADETASMQRLFKAAVGLRIEDWSVDTVGQFISSIKGAVDTVAKYIKNTETTDGEATLSICFSDDSGSRETRRFKPVNYSPRARLLKNEIRTALDEMGESIDDSEKRQVLFDALKEIC